MNLEPWRLCGEKTALDLGCGSGSASYDGWACRVIAIDLRVPAEVPCPVRGGFLQADAAALPLPDACCDLVLAQHALEHIANWRGALREAARVLKPDGILVVIVPDGYCLSDAVFRFLDKSREHVNRFRREELVAVIEQETGLRLNRWQRLYSSYSFLNRQPGKRFGGRARMLNWVQASLLRINLLGWNALARAADRRLGTRWSVYGWMLCFRSGGLEFTTEEPGQRNVCIQCGSAHDAAWLIAQGHIRGRLLHRYDCPACGAFNLFFG